MAEVRNSETGAMLTLEISNGVCKQTLEKYTYATSIQVLFSWNLKQQDVGHEKILCVFRLDAEVQ
jgi:hypothetical protein